MPEKERGHRVSSTKMQKESTHVERLYPSMSFPNKWRKRSCSRTPTRLSAQARDAVGLFLAPCRLFLTVSFHSLRTEHERIPMKLSCVHRYLHELRDG